MDATKFCEEEDGSLHRMTPTLDFVVAGAQKSATSWLYYCLREHSEIHVSPKKTEEDYLGGDLHAQHGDAWFFDRLGKAGRQRIGHVSVNYLFDPRSAEVVHRITPGAQIIVVVRDPISRAVSALNWLVRRGLLPETTVEEGLLAAVQASCAHDSSAVPLFAEIIDRGYYDCQIERYLEFFPPDRFCVVLYESIAANPAIVIEQIYRFLGVATGYRPPSLLAQPKRSSYSPSLNRIERMLPRWRLTAKALDYMNRAVARAGFAARRPTLSPALTQRLQELYEPSARRFVELCAIIPDGQRPSDLEKHWAPTFRDNRIRGHA